MFAGWSIRRKLLVVLSLVVLSVTVLAVGGIHGLYTYRGLVRSLRRVYELPLATQMMKHVSHLRVTLGEARALSELRIPGEPSLPSALQFAHEEFRLHLDAARATLGQYREQLTDNSPQDPIGDSRREWETVFAIEKALSRIDDINRNEDWLFDRLQVGKLGAELAYLEELSAELPSYLHENIHHFTDDARSQYRTLIVLSWLTIIIATGAFIAFVKLSYDWIFRPLRILVKGSRKVAAGNFDYRIQLSTRDEMADLAAAMNDMTARFQAIRDDLDRQVQEQTKQVVRSEQLASVGFLAAGVAHEINNPLASIAMCAESLEARLDDVVPADNPEHKSVHKYLQLIQNEAFRCKGITEKLLDFSRIGESKRQPVELCELVGGVIDMISHLGRYSEKHVQLVPTEAVYAQINAQEIKQVVLNLIVNGLDSLDPGGTVRVEIGRENGQAVLRVRDDGCGMSETVLEHLFEPFFTCKRAGQTGTGLGLSIAFRIVADHAGALVADSEGPGRGSCFTVRLPLAQSVKERDYRYQAA